MNARFTPGTLVRRIGLSAFALLCFCAGSVSADLPEGYFFVSTAGLDSPTYGVGHTNIQEAIDASSAGNTVWIEDGFVCDTGGTFMSPQTNRIVLDKAITLRSVSGTTNNPVMIVGAHHDPVEGIINGTAAIRPLYVSANATIVGLMLTNGATATTTCYGGGAHVTASGSATVFSNSVIVANHAASHGGGVFAQSATEFWHCHIIGNKIPRFRGGGVYRGTLRYCVIKDNETEAAGNGAGGGLWGGVAEHCHFEGNVSRIGGGVHGSTVSHSTFVNNDASWSGGGAWDSTLEHCVLIDNTSSGQNGGGASASTLIDCVLTGNSASYHGHAIWGGKALRCVITNNVGGRIGSAVIYDAEVIQCVIKDNAFTTRAGGIVRYGTVINSLLTGNVADHADAQDVASVVRDATIYNSTIADNAQGRATVNSTLVNTIVWNNWQSGWDNVATNSLIDAAAVVSGENNLDTDPLFVGSGEWPYRLQGASPCIDHGISGFDWLLPSHPDTQGLDLSGRRRVYGSAVDLGAFEFMPMGTQILVY